MQTHSKTPLCRYHYDPLDRLVDCKLSGQESARRFYQKDRLATEINGALHHSIMQHEDHLLAQQQPRSGTVETSLLATDQQRSVLKVLEASTLRSIAHTPYGHRPLASGLLSLLGFNGERPDPVTGHYLLGNGYRAFNPVLMRFNSPDSWSPFGAGGLNAYAYCVGNPINRNDPTGHSSRVFFRAGKIFASSNQAVKTGRIAQTNAVHSAATNNSRPPKTTIKNIHSLATDVLTFDDIHHNKPRLNIMAHGTAERKNGVLTTLIKSAPRNLTPEEIYNLAVSAGINFNNYKSVRLLICYSANGGGRSLAARLSQLTKLPVKGYIGTVHYSPSPTPFYKALEEQSSLFHHNRNGSFTFRGKLEVAKQNPFNPGTDDHNNFNYQSATHHSIRS